MEHEWKVRSHHRNPRRPKRGRKEYMIQIIQSKLEGSNATKEPAKDVSLVSLSQLRQTMKHKHNAASTNDRQEQTHSTRKTEKG